MAPSNFSPILFTLRPADNNLNATGSIEGGQPLSAGPAAIRGRKLHWSGRILTNLAWSKQNCIPQLSDCSSSFSESQGLNGQTNVHTRDNALGGVYSFTYDVAQGKLLSQRLTAFYNSQCCGVAIDYQRFNYGGVTAGLPVASDHRFFLSFSLAGLGNFSPFNGAMSGVPR